MVIKYNKAVFLINQESLDVPVIKKRKKKSERISLRKIIYRYNFKPFRRVSFQTKNIISLLQFLMLLIPLLLCSSSSSVIKNEFKNGFDKQWTKKLLFLRLFSTILLISHSPLPLNYLRFHLKNRSYISKEIISLLKQRTQMKVISLHVTIFISNIEEYS